MGVICCSERRKSTKEKQEKGSVVEEGAIENKQVQKNNKNKKKVNEDEEMDEIEREIEEMNNQKSSNDLKEKLKSLYDSYYNAKTYFCSNDLKEREVDAIQKCKILFSAKKLLEEGKLKEINMEKLPGIVTPEYITGYTKEEREEKIKFIIGKLREERDYTKKILEKKVEDAKKMAKRLKKENIEKFIIESKKILDAEKSKVDKLNKDITTMNQILQNEYIPVPEYFLVFEEHKIEKKNESIPEYVMRINVSNLTYTKSNPMVVLYLKLEDNTEMKKEIKPNKNGIIDETFDWVFNDKDIRNIVRSKINIYLFRTYTIKSDKPKGESELSLRSLKNTDNASGACALKMLSGKKDTNIDVLVQIRSALIEKEYESDYKETIKIKRIYPEFKIHGDNYIPKRSTVVSGNDNQNYISVTRVFSEIEKKKKDIKVIPKTNTNTNKNDVIESTVIDNSNKKESKINLNINKNNNNNVVVEKIDRKAFKEEELNDVEFYLDNLNSLKVLKDRLKSIEGIIAKIDGRTPRELMQKKIKIGVKIKQFENQMRDGDFGPNDYLALMEQQLKHDLLLYKFLKQENEINKAKIVYNRINLLNEEINELKKFIQ